jgi:hypothetical protein
MESETCIAEETPEIPKTGEIQERRKSSNGRILGRPRKSDIIAKKKPGKPGRPPGDAAILNEFKARILNSPKSKRVLQKILEAALDDDHKHQAVAWKLVAERIVPAAIFEGDVKRAGTGNHIQITISGVPGVEINGEETGFQKYDPEYEDIEEAEFVEEEDPDEGL